MGAMFSSACGGGAVQTMSETGTAQVSESEGETSPCAAPCTTGDVGQCVQDCLIEHCAAGSAVCPPASCRQTGAESWECSGCAASSTTQYEPLGSGGDACITGSDVSITGSRDTSAATDDCATEAHYSFECGAADEPSRSPTALHYTGPDISVADALARRPTVVVAELVNLGRRDTGSPGQSYYDGARARIVRALVGRLSGEIDLVYTVQVVPDRIAETPPSQGQQYILFLVREGSGLRAVKILPSTPANEAEVLRAVP